MEVVAFENCGELDKHQGRKIHMGQGSRQGAPYVSVKSLVQPSVITDSDVKDLFFSV